MNLNKKTPKSRSFKKLPVWNLKEFYISPESDLINKDLDEIRLRAKKFEKKYERKVKTLSSNNLFNAISELEEIDMKISKIMSYAYLLYASNIENENNKVFFQKIQEKVTNLYSPLIFFSLELNLIKNKNLKKHFKYKKLLKYKNWIKLSLLYKPHQLNKDLEKIISEKNITSSLAWSRLFDETIASLRFSFKNKQLTSTEIFNFLSDKDSKKRKEAALSIGRTLKQNIHIFTTISNVLAKDKSINDKWRKFSNPVSSRNLSNVVEDKVIDNLSSSVQVYYPKLSHRYYALKAKWFSKKKLMYWDRNAPLPFQINKIYSWEDAKSIVINSYESFSGQMGEIAKLFFDKNWIDAALRKGKQNGAFSASTVPSMHPFILLNYQGKLRDVSTLAHELGHGIHQYLASEQGHFNSSTPLTLAETASVFGEMLTFKYLLSNEKNIKNQKVLLANKIEDMLNTVVRQIAFFEFERQVHIERKKKELTKDEICNIWMDVQSQSLGPSIVLQEEYRYYWSYIPHFIHSPFYVYAYAFGDCLVNSLYSLYQESPNGFKEKYITLLKSGGSKKYNDLLKPFNFNPRDKKFWKKGLDVINKLINELENLES